MLFAVLYDPILHITTPVQLHKLPLQLRYPGDQFIISPAYLLFEPVYRRRLFCSRMLAPAERRQHPLIFNRPFLLEKLVHQFANCRLKGFQLPTQFQQVLFLCLQLLQVPALLCDHPRTVQLLQADSGLHQPGVDFLLLVLQNLQFRPQIFLFSLS